MVGTGIDVIHYTMLTIKSCEVRRKSEQEIKFNNKQTTVCI